MTLFTDVSEHKRYGKTTRQFQVPSSYINLLFKDKYVDLPDNMIHNEARGPFDDVLWPNQAVCLQAVDSQQSALTLVTEDGMGLEPVHNKIEYFGIQPRNMEQQLLFSLLDDPDIRVVVVTGAAGTGKSTAIGSYALDHVLGNKGQNDFEKLILAKPLEIVTRTRFWGTVPGDENDKFGPFLKSFSIMFENMIGKSGTRYIQQAVENKIIEFLPLELMRGATLRNAVVWYDEAQNLNVHECATLGTRIDDVGHSKLILSGDLNQRDNARLKRNMTGIHKLCTSEHFLKSDLTAHIDLKVIERGRVAELFHNVFEKDINSTE